MSTPPPNPVTFACIGCGKTFEAPAILFGGRELLPERHCEPCVSLNAITTATDAENDAQAQRRDEWLMICPPLYRDTDPARISSIFWDASERWDPSGRIGLGFAGKSGRGKTRSAFAALEAAHQLGRSCAYITGSGISRTIRNGFDINAPSRAASNRTLAELRTADVLLLDDIGKQKWTDHAEQEVYDILEERTAHCRPIIWTMNSTAREFRERISADRGDAILRRLTDGEFAAEIAVEFEAIGTAEAKAA